MQSTVKVTLGRNIIYQNVSKSQSHCSWRTWVYVWKGFGKKKLNGGKKNKKTSHKMLQKQICLWVSETCKSTFRPASGFNMKTFDRSVFSAEWTAISISASAVPDSRTARGSLWRASMCWLYTGYTYWKWFWISKYWFDENRLFIGSQISVSQNGFIAKIEVRSGV